MNSEVLRFVVKAKDDASRTLKGVGGSFSALGKVAKVGMAVAAVGVGVLIAALANLVAFIRNAKKTYEDWMQQLDDLQDVSGMSAKATSLLAFQVRMADADVRAVTKGVGIFTKNLDAARQGTESNLVPFERLGINIRNADGSLRSLDDILFEARDRLSAVEDQTTRNGIAAKLFGRGFAELADWLDKSAAEMKTYIDWAKQLGMVMGEKSMKAFQDYRKNQRKLSVGWDAIKINAYAALVPLINDLMPRVIKLIWRAAEWMGDFRKLVEKKGWGAAFTEMVPGGQRVIDILKNAKAWWARNKDEIKRAGKQVADLFRLLGKVATWYADNKRLVKATWQGMTDALNIALRPLQTMYGILNNIKDAMGWILGHGDETANAYQGSGKSSATTTKPHGKGGAKGAAVFAPLSGESWVLHGRETVVAHDNPALGLADLARSGIIGGGVTFNNCAFSAHTPHEIAESVVGAIVERQRGVVRTSGSFA